MDDLISRKALIEAFKEEFFGMYSDDFKYMINWLEELPTAEPELIRCKDCKHRPIDVGAYKPYEAPNGDLICPFICADDEHYNDMPPDDFFCAYGERKDDQL